MLKRRNPPTLYSHTAEEDEAEEIPEDCHGLPVLLSYGDSDLPKPSQGKRHRIDWKQECQRQGVGLILDTTKESNDWIKKTRKKP